IRPSPPTTRNHKIAAARRHGKRATAVGVIGRSEALQTGRWRSSVVRAPLDVIERQVSSQYQSGRRAERKSASPGTEFFSSGSAHGRSTMDGKPCCSGKGILRNDQRGCPALG